MKPDCFPLRIHQLLMACSFWCCCAFINSPAVKAAPDNQIAAPVLSDSAQAKNGILSFLRWYKTNLHKAAGFPLLTKDSKGYYQVNKKACGDYLNFVKTSKRVSAKYIGYWQTYFNDKAISLKKEKIKSDVPEGFDFDFILITQEPEIILNNIASLQLTTVSINRREALISVKLPSDSSVQYEFEMRKGTWGWQIDYIATPNYD